jgi:hypothetical protein
MKKIFIPKTCRVGFQERDDTFTKRLAYVICYGADGKLRKEPSWKSWCHTPGGTYHYDRKTVTVDVTPFDFANTPTSGFVLNKGHTRHPWGHFGNRRTVIRICDPRGIEFEITPENLVGLLMHTDCSRREIQGDLVYAWCGPDLMLLPCSSEEYASAIAYTALQHVRVSAKDLKEGFAYLTKSEKSLIYLGRHMWYDRLASREGNSKRVGSMQHIFCDLDGTNSKPVKSVSSTISKQLSHGCHDKYADWVDAYLKSPESSKIVGWERHPIPSVEWDQDWTRGGYGSLSLEAVTEECGGLLAVTIAKYPGTYRRDSYMGRMVVVGASPLVLAYRRHHIIQDDGSTLSLSVCNNHYNQDVLAEQSKFFHLIAVFENGLKQKWR